MTWADLALDSRRCGAAPSLSKAFSLATMRGARPMQGVDAVIVSNHGGRQLDGVAAGLRALPEVVAAAAARSKC